MEQQARRTAAASAKSKRKRSRSSKGSSENTETNSYGGTGDGTEAEAGEGAEGLELPSELLAEVKSEGLKRTEDESTLITRSEEVKEGATPARKGGRSIRAKTFSDTQRR